MRCIELLISEGGAETKSQDSFLFLDQPSPRAAKGHFASALFSRAHACSGTCFSRELGRPGACLLWLTLHYSRKVNTENNRGERFSVQPLKQRQRDPVV